MRLIGIIFLLGVVSASYLPVLPHPAWCGLIFVLLPVVLLGPKYEWLKVIAVFLMAGLWLIAYIHLVVPNGLPETLDGETITVTGEIVSIPANDPRRNRFDFDIHEVDDGDVPWAGKVRLSWYQPRHELWAGQQWRLKIKLKPVHGFANPGGFDYEAQLFRQAIAATGYVREAEAAQLLAENVTLNRLRQSLSSAMRQAMPESVYSGLLIALTTGDRQFINKQQWQVLMRTGTVHLMAISGLHIGLIYALFFWFGRAIWRLSASLCLLRPAQDAAIIAGLIAAVIYAAMAGFAIPTQRALIMLSVVAFAVLSRRLTSPLDVLQAALLLVLLLDPLAILSAGFWLSFAAVAVILLTLDYSPSATRPSAWYQLVKIQWVIALGLLPLTSLFFYQVSLVAPVTNLIAVPWVGLLVVPIALSGAAATVVSPQLAQWLLGLVDSLMQLLWWILLPASESPFAVVHPAHPPMWVLLCVLSGLALIMFHSRPTYRIGGVLLLAPLFMSAASPVKKHEFQMDVLDVGQGLAVVVRTAEKTLLYDAGYSNDSGFDVGKLVVLPYLRHEGISALDRVVLSHDDRDHVGGYDSIQREISVGQLSVMPGSRFLQAPHASVCSAGEQWQWDGVIFEFLHPTDNPDRKDNNRSCVLKVSSASGSVLLTGDIEQKIERQLLRDQTEKLRSYILLVPHHGSASSSSEDFIVAVGPREVVYSAGYRNRWGFPKTVVQGRYQKVGVKQIGTAESGMLRYRFGGQAGVYQRRVYRQENRRFWHQSTGS